jgi:NADH-quinone oxidoreductase subunit E
LIEEDTTMLTEQERQTIEAQIAQYPDRRAASIDCLVRLQESRGWLPDEALEDLAPVLGMSVHELEALATFYNRLHRHPVGRHLLTFCDSASCWILGCDELREALEKRLGVVSGETTQDGRFTLLPTQCLGACDHAPVLAVDDELHLDLDLDLDRLANLLDQYD